MGAFQGILNHNEDFSGLYNMIIGQRIFTDDINLSTELVDKAKIDGTLFGDTKLFYSCDIIPVHKWGVNSSTGKTGYQDVEAADLLEVERPQDPECQAIVLDEFRQVRVTLDEVITKRAWTDAQVFGVFNAYMEQLMTITKRLYDDTLYKAFIGTTTTNVGKQLETISFPAGTSDEDEAKLIAEKVANILVDIKEPSRDFNDYGHVQAYPLPKIKVIWKAGKVNKIKKIDVPEIYHKDGLIDKFEEVILHDEYWGEVNSTDVAGDGVCVRALQPGFAKKSGEADIYVLAGALVPTGYKMGAGLTYNNGSVDNDGNYIPDPQICKFLVEYPPLMSAFEISSSFWNPRALITTRYLTFGHNKLEYLKGKPFITLKEVPAA